MAVMVWSGTVRFGEAWFGRVRQGTAVEVRCGPAS